MIQPSPAALRRPLPRAEEVKIPFGIFSGCVEVDESNSLFRSAGEG